MKTRAVGDSFHSCFEFSQTFTSVTITLRELGKNVFHFFYKINAQKSFHRVK